MIYFIMEMGNGAYCEAPEKDPLYNPNTCIIVPKKPHEGSIWNNITKQWDWTIEGQQNYIRPIRNIELDRTDRFILPDYPITPEELLVAKQYREKLREVPDKITPQEMVMPECPEFMKFKP